MSPSLNRDQRERLALLGRTSAPTRYVERTDANRIRVVAIDFGGVELGQCADSEGNLIARICVPQNDPKNQDAGAEYPTTTEHRPGNPPVVSGASVPVDPTAMTYGMFRQYSTQVGTTVDTSVAIGPVGSDAKVYFSRNFLVLEWRRYDLETSKLNPSSEPGFVSAVERGVAVRIIFDVKLSTVDSKFTASFGIADLSAVLARNEATVEVSYEILGTTLDPLPGSSIIITSLTEYLGAVDEFFSAVNMISRAVQHYQSGATGDFDVNEGTALPPKKIKIDEDTFSNDVLAYYVSGRDVGDHFALLRNVDECKAVTAKHKYLLDDIEWNRTIVSHYEGTKKKDRTARENALLRQAKIDLDALRLERRDLAATSAQLNCEQTCAAESARIQKQEGDRLSQLDWMIKEWKSLRPLQSAETLLDQSNEAQSEARLAREVATEARAVAETKASDAASARLLAEASPTDRDLKTAAMNADKEAKKASDVASAAEADAKEKGVKAVNARNAYQDLVYLEREIANAEEEKKEVKEKVDSAVADADKWCMPVRLTCDDGDDIHERESMCAEEMFGAEEETPPPK